MGKGWWVDIAGRASMPESERGALAAALAWMEQCAARFGLDGARPGRVGAVVRAPAGLLARAGRGEYAARLMLAHEMAHVAQLIGGTEAADVAACEAEAAAASLAALGGRRFACRCAPPAGAVLHWGLVGHYYTVLYLALACGASANEAATLAYFTEMSDLVKELDATEAGENLVLSHGVLGDDHVHMFVDQAELLRGLEYSRVETAYDQPIMYDPATYNPATDPARQAQARYLMYHRRDYFSRTALQDVTIQMGLHALTGELAVAEQAFRRRLLEGEPNTLSPRFGLCVHAFGDSFAHVKFGTTHMYDAGIGHAVEISDMHGPDVVSKHSDNYLAYACQLYQVLSPRFARARLGWAEIEARLVEVIRLGREMEDLGRLQAMLTAPDRPWSWVGAGEELEQSAQIRLFHTMIREQGGGSPRDPDDTNLAEWRQFQRRRPDGWTGDWLSPGDLYTFRSWAMDWATAARPSGAAAIGVASCRGAAGSGPRLPGRP